MSSISSVFPYQKSIMLNILYDALETLGFKIEQANSERGTIIAHSTGEPQRRMQIACNSILLEEKARVEIFPEIEDEESQLLSKMVIAEISTITTGIGQGL